MIGVGAPLRRGLSLVEVLVVTGVIAMLVGILVPGLSAARRSAQQVRCATQLRELARANQLYSAAERDTYCPGAARFSLNLERWHGRRASVHEEFTGDEGPLRAYLDDRGALRACPGLSTAQSGFEAGAGGYGYNNDYVGVRLTSTATGGWAIATDEGGVPVGWVGRPSETVMFADTALAATAGLIEYGFAHARFIPAVAGHRWDPSIHFRHEGRANVAWVDGHVDGRTRDFTWWSGFYPTDPEPLLLGWFGDTDTNAYFDLD